MRDPIQAAPTLPLNVRDADGQPEKVEPGKVRVVETTLGASGTRELLVDRDSAAGIAALSGASPRWRLVPEAILVVNPGGKLVWIREDLHSHELKLARTGKDGWRMARESEESVPVPEPEPPSPTRWARHPNGRIVRIVLGSHDAELCDRARHGWKWATEHEVERRQLLGQTYSAISDQKET